MRNSLVIPEKTFLAIPTGASLETVKTKLGIAAHHEFTVTIANGSYILIGCYVVPSEDNADGGGEIYLLFRDQTLVKTVKPVPLPQHVETEIYNGHTVQVSRSMEWDIEDTAFVTKTINAPALTEDQIIDYLRPYTGPGRESPGVLPAAMVTAPLAAVLSPTTISLAEKEYAMNQDLFKRYDGCLASIGMSRDQIESLYGNPLQTYPTKSGGTALIYGCSGSFPLVDENGRLPLVDEDVAFKNMAVEFDASGRVTAIYSDAFFCDKWKKDALTPVSASNGKS
ncbi:MAG TPA: hypothetical protein VK737_03140 [Opitutales bacterium]|jgi:hypothetical protein|nr:hypothetical protein [Opitutales bacterium]